MKKSSSKIVVVSGFIALCLLITHLINKFIFYINTFKEHLHSNHGFYYEWRFGRIYYTKQGNGPSLLLVHDLNNTSSQYEWKEVADKLSKNYTVYTIDLIGCGCSDKPKLTYTNYLYVQLISDFIRDVIGEKVSIVSSRNSCSISIMACYIDSNLFSKVFLVNPRDIEDLKQFPTKKHRLYKRLLNIPILGTLIYNIKNSRYQLSKSFYRDYLSNKKCICRYINAYSEAAHTSGSNSKYVYNSIKCHYTNTNITHGLKDISNPIIILEGSDCCKAQKIIDQYEGINASIESIFIENAKELPHVENPEQVANLIDSNIA